MSHPVLTRLNLFVYKSKTPPSDLSQVPFGNAVVELYAQGATVKQSVTVGSASTAVTVYDNGSIKAGSVLRVGPNNGPVLKVDSVPSSGQVWVSKVSGSADVVLTTGTRLFVLSDRPLVYADPLGTVPVGSSATADATGRVAAYISEPRFDYVVTDAVGVSLGQPTSGALSGGQTLSWPHADSGGTGKVLVAGVSWIGSTNPPAVTYGGQAMTVVAATGNCAVYTLKDPPAASNVVAQFGVAIGAVGGAITAAGADVTELPRSAIAGIGGTDSAAVAVAGSTSAGVVVDTLSLRKASGVPSDVTPETGQTERWDRTAYNESPPPQLEGAGSSKVGGAGSSGKTFGTGWTWAAGSAYSWDLIALELRRKVVRFGVDMVGGTAPNPSWLNARDYPSLQAAIDALPETGGEVFLDGGSHFALATIEVNKNNVTLRGEGNQNTLIIGAQNPTYDIVRVTKGNCRLINLQIHGAATQAGSGSCLVLSGPEVKNCCLENLSLQQAGKYGLLIQDIDSLVVINSESLFNYGRGVRITRSGATPWKISMYGTSCSQNQGRGFWAEPDAGAPSDVGDSLLLLGCGMESNGLAGGVELEGSAVFASNCGKVDLVGCQAEWNPASTLQPEEFFLFNGVKGALVTGSLLVGKGTAPTQQMTKRGARFVSCDSAVFTNNTGWRLADEVARFDANSNNAVEFGNWELEYSGISRVAIEGRAFGLSKRVVQLYAYKPSQTIPPVASLNPGAMLFAEGAGADGTGQLRVFDGQGWRSVVYA